MRHFFSLRQIFDGGDDLANLSSSVVYLVVHTY